LVPEGTARETATGEDSRASQPGAQQPLAENLDDEIAEPGLE